MEVREATMADAPEVLAFVRAKAQFDRELGAFAGNLGTTEELIRRHLFGPRPFAFALLAGGPGPAVGFALYYFRYSSFRGRPSLWLDGPLRVPARAPARGRPAVDAPAGRVGDRGRLHPHRLGGQREQLDWHGLLSTARSQRRPSG